MLVSSPSPICVVVDCVQVHFVFCTNASRSPLQAESDAFTCTFVDRADRIAAARSADHAKGETNGPANAEPPDRSPAVTDRSHAVADRSPAVNDRPHTFIDRPPAVADGRGRRPSRASPVPPTPAHVQSDPPSEPPSQARFPCPWPAQFVARLGSGFLDHIIHPSAAPLR